MNNRLGGQSLVTLSSNLQHQATPPMLGCPVIKLLLVLLLLSGCATTTEIVRITDCNGSVESYLSVGCKVAYSKEGYPMEEYFMSCLPNQAKRVNSYISPPEGVKAYGYSGCDPYEIWVVDD